MFSSQTEMLYDINQYIKISNVSVSVWWYKETEQKYDSYGRKTRFGPKYSSAITDKLFFDIDCLTKEGKVIQEYVDSTHKFWNWVIKNNFKRKIMFTSGGYQALIGASVYPEIYESCILQIREMFSLPNEIIDLARMYRVPGSFNYGNSHKSERNTFCISLQDEEVFMSFNELRKLSSNQRRKIHTSGINKYTPKNLKRIVLKKKNLDRRSDFSHDSSTDDVLGKYGWCYDDICPNIRSIIEQPRVNHQERMMVIKYLKSICNIKYGDMIILLPKILTAQHGMGNDGTHSIEEGQVDSIYSRNLFFNNRRMREEGYCDIDCDDCYNYIRKLKQI